MKIYSVIITEVLDRSRVVFVQVPDDQDGAYAEKRVNQLMTADIRSAPQLGGEVGKRSKQMRTESMLFSAEVSPHCSFPKV